jgi:hypothetical protein
MQILADFIHVACDWRPLWYNLYVTGRQSHANFACTGGQLFAKPPVVCEAASILQALFELKNEDAIKKSENLNNTCACQGLSINTMHGPIQSRETVSLNIFLFPPYK